MMRLEAVGLLQTWKNAFNADPYHCLDKIEKEIKEKTKNRNKIPLTLKGLSGAFFSSRNRLCIGNYGTDF